jgi:hypothetical protein
VLSAAGLAVLAAAVGRAFTAGLPAPERLVGTCARALVPQPSPAWVATMVLAALVALSLVHVGRVVVALLAERARVRRLAADVARLGGREVRIVRTPRAVAFCAGLRRPRVHLSSGTVELLEPRELEAVLAHEQHHVRRRDPLRMAARRLVERALFFVPGIGALSRRLDELAEQAADEHAVRAVGGDVRPLAGALLRFDAAGAPAGAGIGPARVDRLIGAAPGWSLPYRELALAAVVLVSLAALIAAGGSIGVAVAAALQLCLMSAAALGAITSPLAAVVASSRRRA